jgi:hypothetical protein
LNCVFLKSIFDLIENNGEDDELVLTSIKFILSLNLRFDYPDENPIMLTLLAVNEQLSCRELIERLILLFNRSGKIKKNKFFILFSYKIVDPIECKTMNSVIKFFVDLFGDQATTSDALLFDSDRRLIVEIISRELSDRSITDEVKMIENKFLYFSYDILENNSLFIFIRINASYSINNIGNMYTY